MNEMREMPRLSVILRVAGAAKKKETGVWLSGGLITAAVIVLSLVVPAFGGYVEIGGGWAAEWDDSLDPFVSIVSDGVSGDAVFIEKSAEFRPEFRTIPIVFRQIAWPAVGNIVIEDEIITNNSGFDWTGFKMEVLDGPDVWFDPVKTMESGGGGPIGFSISPFTTAEFVNDNRRLDIGGGVLCISQFTLYGDCRKGRRPSFTAAAPPEEAAALYERFLEILATQGLQPERGVFGAYMQVEIHNDGPVTLMVESP